MKPATEAGGYIWRRFFHGRVNAAMTTLAILAFVVLVISALVYSGFSWFTLTTILTGLLLLIVFLSLNLQNYYLHSQSRQVEARIMKAVRTELDTHERGVRAQLESYQDSLDRRMASWNQDTEGLLKQIQDEFTQRTASNDSRMAELNEETFRAHREVSYILSQLRDEAGTGHKSTADENLEDRH